MFSGKAGAYPSEALEYIDVYIKLNYFINGMIFEKERNFFNLLLNLKCRFIQKQKEREDE